MALKDLVVKSGKVSEELIEAIITPFVFYEIPDDGADGVPQISFKPDAVGKDNETKVLTYLVAQAGWKYVLENSALIPANPKPADLESATGIPGGTLRPILKKLKENNLLKVNDGRYSVSLGSLPKIQQIISGEAKTKAAKKSSPNKSSDSKGEAKKGKGKSKGNLSLKGAIDRLVEQAYFTEWRPLSSVLERLHEQAINAKLTSLSGPMADLVRDGTLVRKKVEIEGRKVYAYKSDGTP